MRTRVLVATLLLTLTSQAQANERRFTYTYESAVLSKGEKELEPWTTIRAGRDNYFVRFDHRLEFEVGLTHRLQTAFYLNLRSQLAKVGDARESRFSFKGISSEWKYKLLDSVADVVGLALYFELTAAPDEIELEGKLILDKRVGRFLVAFNAVFEYEWSFASLETEREAKLEQDLGLGVFITPAWFAGIELRVHSVFVPSEGLEHSALFGGPTVSYATKSWWVALTILPQIAAFKRIEGKWLDLKEYTRLESRLIFGWHI